MKFLLFSQTVTIQHFMLSQITYKHQHQHIQTYRVNTRDLNSVKNIYKNFMHDSTRSRWLSDFISFLIQIQSQVALKRRFSIDRKNNKFHKIPHLFLLLPLILVMMMMILHHFLTENLFTIKTNEILIPIVLFCIYFLTAFKWELKTVAC
jgi:hypothetical protein